jgi:ABC-type transporter Mla subunit MlaD
VSDPYSITQIFWSTDPMTQRAIGLVLGLALTSAVVIFIPLIARVMRLFLFEKRLHDWVDYAATTSGSAGLAQSTTTSPANATDAADAKTQGGLDREELRGLFANSPVAAAYEEFERRWSTAVLAEGIERAPIRLMDIFDERPLLPFGPRRSLLPVMPGLFLGVGVFAALTGLIPSLANLTMNASFEDPRSAWMATQLGLAMRASAWGFMCAVGASLSGRLIEGAFEARSRGLDAIVEHAFGSVSPGELAEITRQTQQKSLETLGTELARFANELNERLDRGLQRIEQSTARSASLVSQEQRGALHTVVQELSLSVRQGVEHHLSELRSALQRAVEHQTAVAGGLAEAFERMVENSQAQDRVALTLADSARSVDEAAQSMRESASEMKPILEHLSSTSRGLADTAESMNDTQLLVARSAEGVRSSLEHAATGVDDQRQFIELSLGEIRRTLAGLGDGLGESLQRSLREVDDVLSGTVGQLSKTLTESNETIERLAGPIRAAEGSTRETHVALDRVRAEVEALGQWMSLTVKPLRSGLADVEGRAEDIARTMVEFTHNTRQIDKTMEALREGIHQESRRLQTTGSELSRRLKLASDTVGQLEGAASAGVRRRRSEASDEDFDPTDFTLDTPDTDANAESSADIDRTLSPELVDTPNAKRESGRERDANGIGATLENTGMELAGLEYDESTPQEHGSDSGDLFEDESEPPSNVRHLPTRDREIENHPELSAPHGSNTSDDKTSDDSE